MADREDFATEVGQLIKGRSPVGHHHDDRYIGLAPTVLGTTQDLDTVTTPRRYRTISSATTGNPALHYPPGALHGYLDVIDMNPSGQTPYIEQVWLDTWNGWMAFRRLYNGVWAAWRRFGEAEAVEAVAPLAARVTALEDAPDLGSAVRVQPGAAVVYGEDRPDAWVYPDRTTIYWHRPDGTRIVPGTYLGDGYVGALGAVTGYTDMLVTKAEANGTVDVSCIDPATQRHVTIRLQGRDNAAWLDDMQIIEEIWIGAVTGGVPSMDQIISPRSNMEYAFQIDFGATGVSWVPYHGTETAISTGEPRGLYRMDGTPIDVSGLAIGDTITGLDGIRLRQSNYARHPDSGGTDWVRIDTTTTISPDGMLQVESTWEALRDVRLGTNYAPMTPVQMGHVDTLHVQGGGTYALDTTAPAATYYTDVTEGDQAESMLLTGPGTTFVAVSFLDPDKTLLRGHPRAGTDTQMRVESRNTGWLKIYPSGFDKGSYIVKGTTWRTGAQWRFGEAVDPAQYA